LGWKLEPHQAASEFPWLAALASGVRQVGTRLILGEGTEQQKIFRVNAVPILDPKGSSQGTIAVFDDISELEEKSRLLEEMIGKLAASQVAIERSNKELTYLATRDPLTDCLNRRALYQYLEGKSEGGRVTDSEYCCIMADIDHFKRVNDTYGHGVGDDVIKMTASTIMETVRDVDRVARFGGEEFCIILPGVSLEQAAQIAERCREKIEAKDCSGVKVTGSFGVTSIRLGAQDGNELIQQADQALYYSKQHGRNQVTRWQADMIATETAPG
jgi:diguanylate cyclase (GGDEF)-like protein